LVEALAASPSQSKLCHLNSGLTLKDKGRSTAAGLIRPAALAASALTKLASAPAQLSIWPRLYYGAGQLGMELPATA